MGDDNEGIQHEGSSQDVATSTLEHNVILMSEAGKPIFAKYGSETEIARQCSLLQAIRTNVLSSSSLNLGDIQSLRSSNLSMVFLTIGRLTLVSISKASNGCKPAIYHATEAYARLQLEYLHAQLIFHLTDQVQAVYQQDPSYDLRMTLSGTGDKMLDGLWQATEPTGNQAPFLVGACPMAFPISYKARNRISRSLQSLGGTKGNPNIVFALLVAGDKVLSVVQPSYRPHQLKLSDLQLALSFLRSTQPALYTSNALWIPMCLPRFNQSAFLYAYTECWDASTELLLVLLSSHSTTAEFQSLRLASAQLKQNLGVSTFPLDNVASLPGSTNPSAQASTSSSTSDVELNREESFEEGYVNIPAPMVQASLPPTTKTSSIPLLQELQQMPSKWTVQELVQTYLTNTDTKDDTSSYHDLSSLLLHFVFRYDVAVKVHGRFPGGKGHFSQCISSRLPKTGILATPPGQERLWNSFQKLQLRLRLGSATPEAIQDALDMIAQDALEPDMIGFPGIAKDCPAMGLVESPPNLHGVSYIIEGGELYLGMNGRDFELYMVLSSSSSSEHDSESTLDEPINIKRAAELGTKLVRSLMADDKNLFLTSPLTWRD